MSGTEDKGSMAASLAFAALSGHIERAGGSPKALKDIAWLIGAHPQLLAHGRVFANLQALLRTEAFAEGSTFWAGEWRHEVATWIHTLEQVHALEPKLRSDPALQQMYKVPRHHADHLLLRHGVTRHPLAAALFNQMEPDGTPLAIDAAARYQSLRAHILAIYFEARWRAALGVDDFMLHTGAKEFAPVPIGAGPVCLCLREYSLAKYGPLLMQLPSEPCTLDFAARLCSMQPDFSAVQLGSRQDAARYFKDLKRYVNTLPHLLNAEKLKARIRRSHVGAGDGDGGSEARTGWVGGANTIQRELDVDWAEDAPPVTIVFLPEYDERDLDQEEFEDETPDAKDASIELYDPTEASKRMSQMRFRLLAIELQQQAFTWSLDVASRADRERSLRTAQGRIDAYLHGDVRNQAKARLEAISGVLLKAAALYGWAPASTADIAIQKIDALNAKMLDSIAYVKQDQITLLATADNDSTCCWRAEAFVVPGLAPRYSTQLAADVSGSGRLRQAAFLLPDTGGFGSDLLAIAARADRLPKTAAPRRRALGVESKTAQALARDCAAAASDPICDDPRASLTVDRLRASIHTAITHICGDSVPAWIICFDERRTGEARLHYTQVRASNLVSWHQEALRWLQGGDVTRHESASHIAALQPGWVGCRHVADAATAHRLIDELQADAQRAIDLERRSEIRRYHNDYILLAWLRPTVLLGLRPIAADGPCLHHLYELRRGIDMLTSFDAAGVVDKQHAHQDKSRLLPILTLWQEVAARLERHNSAVVSRLDLVAEWRALDAGAQRLFVIKDDESLVPVTPAWVKARLAERGCPLPPNFGRALLRTEWLDQQCNGRLIDALLGHFNHGQNWFSKHSTHSPRAYLAAINSKLPEYAEHLHLGPTLSLCVVASERQGHHGDEVHLPKVGLKTPVLRPRTRPIWAGCHLPPALPDIVKDVWSEVVRHAARGDRAEVVNLQWLLKNSDNAHAKTLTGRSLADDESADSESARTLENELLLLMQRHGFPRTVVASWLRLTLAAVRRMQSLGVSIGTTMVAAISSPPDSPITSKATLRLADLATWRCALHEWIRLRSLNPDDDPRYWVVGIALSAVISGMVLDSLLLARILEILAEPGPRRLKLGSGPDGHSFMTVWLPSQAPGGRQLTRWFVDPITELLILRAPSFPGVPTLSSMTKDLNRFLRHHGVPQHRLPGNFGVVVRVARAFWSTRVPQHVVQVAQRGISTTSLQPRTWDRLFGCWEVQSSRPGSTPLATVAPPAAFTIADLGKRDEADDDAGIRLRVDRNSAIAHAAANSGADIDFTTLDQCCAHPWMHDAWDALAPYNSIDEVVARLEALNGAGMMNDFRRGALSWLVRTTLALESEATADTGNFLIGMRRVTSVLLPRLAAEIGEQWFTTLTAQQRISALSALSHELETSASRPDLRRGIKLLYRFEPALSGLNGTSESATADENDHELEDGDQDDRVDARMFTIDEYQNAMAALDSGIDPPLAPEERQDLMDLLALGSWSLARPREYLEVRLGDFEQHGGELTMSVREYAGHSLKTPQGVRRVPLSILAPPDVIERLNMRIARLKAKFADPAGSQALRSLLFSPPAGVAAKAHHDRLLVLLRRVLRNVTGDPKFRVYSLRHAGANWLFLALESENTALRKRIWASHPAMAQWLDQGPILRRSLLGSEDRTDRRALLAITKVMGHLASATTYMHYLHLSHFLQLEAVLTLAEEVPHSVLADAAGIARSSYSEQRAGGWQAVLANARSRAGWAVVEPCGSSERGPEAEEERAWLGVEDLALLLNAHALHHQPLRAVAAHFNLLEEQVRNIIDAAGEMQTLVGATTAEETAIDAEVQGVLMPTMRMNDAERSQMRHLLRNLQDVWYCAPEQTQAAIALLIERMDRRHREWRFCNQQELDCCVTLLAACRIEPTELQIVLRRRHQSASIPAWAKPVLGRYASSSVKVALPDTLTSDEGLDRWICLRLVDRRGNGIANVTARVLFAATLNIAGHRSP